MRLSELGVEAKPIEVLTILLVLLADILLFT
jgi:hypothetical protein